jgi:metal-responsive CopG/Arc/MetJ family transcriptional regulator
MSTKRVLISLDADLLERIDREARRAGATRSGYLRRLAEADLSSAEGSVAATRAESTPRELPGVTGRSAPTPPRSGG